MHRDPRQWQVGLIGDGEIGRILAALAARSDWVISAVTASQAVAVAQACAPAMRQGAWLLAFNSASPAGKQQPKDARP